MQHLFQSGTDILNNMRTMNSNTLLYALWNLKKFLMRNGKMTKKKFASNSGDSLLSNWYMGYWTMELILHFYCKK